MADTNEDFYAGEEGQAQEEDQQNHQVASSHPGLCLFCHQMLNWNIRIEAVVLILSSRPFLIIWSLNNSYG